MSFLRKNLNKGFTLIELLVVITIFAILTGVVLFSQARFNSTILLTNLAYDTALTIRQAQNYGINVKEFTGKTGSSGTPFNPYGVHFDQSYPTSFILFADINDKGKFTTSDLTSCNVAEGCVNRYTIKRGNSISKICKVDINGQISTVCYEKLDVVFRRPNPDAIINAYMKRGDINPVSAISTVAIILKGADSGQRTVKIQSNGLIEVLNN